MEDFLIQSNIFSVIAQYIFIKKFLMKESRTWTEQEDRVLRELREQRGMTKWTQISQMMKKEFEMVGKSGKRCRERYYNYASSKVKRDGWSNDEENLLFRLHNEKGNKWMLIAKELKRPDNAVKSHYHSKLRKALRNINKLVYNHLRNNFKPIKFNLLPKMLQIAEEYYYQSNKSVETIAKKFFDLKNKILSYLSFQEKEMTQDKLTQLISMIKEAHYFNKIYKKPKNKKDIPKRDHQVKKKRVFVESKAKDDQEIIDPSQQDSSDCLSSSQNIQLSEVSRKSSDEHDFKAEAQNKAVDSYAMLNNQHSFPYMYPFRLSYTFPFPMQMMFINSYSPNLSLPFSAWMSNNTLKNSQPWDLSPQN